jgi:hypothetical protein
MYSYREIIITPFAGTNPRENGGGTHASPRTHLRRGHIRRVGPKRIWIQNTIVNPGQRDFVHPSYKVTAPKPKI